MQLTPAIESIQFNTFSVVFHQILSSLCAWHFCQKVCWKVKSIIWWQCLDLHLVLFSLTDRYNDFQPYQVSLGFPLTIAYCKT